MAADRSPIEWTGSTWNVLRGCSRVSLGCGGPHGQGGCYAERVALRFSGPGQPYHGLVKSTPSGPRWTGEVRFIEEALTLPLRWKLPRRIFVNSMSDLFHEKVADVWIDRIFAVMLLAQRHTFQVLTKRPERMRAYLSDPKVVERQLLAMDRILGPDAAKWAGFTSEGSSAFPCPAIHLGVSVEDQPTANARIPHLFETPAAVRWVSYEPALGPVDFTSWLGPLPVAVTTCGMRAANEATREAIGALVRAAQRSVGDGLHWVIIGGESGPGARPFDLAWARSAIAQCRAAGVPVFVKQLGAHPHAEQPSGRMYCWAPMGLWKSTPGCGAGSWSRTLVLRDRKGGDWSEWPADLRVREFPAVAKEA